MKKINNIYIAGVGLCGDGYPNAKNTIRILDKTLNLKITEKGSWFPSNFHLWKAFSKKKISSLSIITSIFYRNFSSALKVFFTCPKTATIYIPYPAIFFLFIYSFIPKGARPKLIADCYISIWDAMYTDRNSHEANSIFSRALHFIEGRALQTADIVLTDTIANAEYYLTIYPKIKKIFSLPLATNPIKRSQYVNSNRKQLPLRSDVLFIGTLIPLHGINVILEAACILEKTHPYIHFTLVGDGQMAPTLENSQYQTLNNLTWKRNWLSGEELVLLVKKSDICLGVFSGNKKSSRVLPFKNYLYLACGSSLVTQNSYSLPQNCPRLPASEIPANCADSLANKLIELATDHIKNTKLKRISRQYFESHLSDEAISLRWKEILSN